MCDGNALSDGMTEQLRLFLLHATASGRKIPLDLERAMFGENNEVELVDAFRNLAQKSQLARGSKPSRDNAVQESLPKVITFPYSRHSSYPELCHLLGVFKPKDVWPCTVDQRKWLEEGKISRARSPFLQVWSTLTRTL